MSSNGSTPLSHGNIITRFVGKFMRKGFSVNTFDSVYDVSGGTMKRSLKWFQLMLLGIGECRTVSLVNASLTHSHSFFKGTMVGAGVFVSTGSVAQDTAGKKIC